MSELFGTTMLDPPEVFLDRVSISCFFLEGGGELLLLRFAFEAQNFDRLSALPLPCPALPCPPVVTDTR